MGQYLDGGVDDDDDGAESFSSLARSFSLNFRAYSSIPSQNALSSRTTGNMNGSRKDSMKTPSKWVGKWVGGGSVGGSVGSDRLRSNRITPEELCQNEGFLSTRCGIS